MTLQPGEKSGSGNCGAANTVFSLDPTTGLVTSSTTKSNDCENHIADAISLALSYEDDSLYLSAAMDKEVADMDAMRFVARYKMSDFTVSAMFQTAEPTVNKMSKKQDSMMLSGSYNMGSVAVRGEVLLVTDSAASLDNNTMLIGAGVDYNFTQSTKAFVNLALKNQEKTGGSAEDSTYLGFGMETRF